MKEMTLAEARLHLLRRWDLEPFHFDFGGLPTGAITAGGGGGLVGWGAVLWVTPRAPTRLHTAYRT